MGAADLDAVARLRDLTGVNHQEAIGVVRGLPLLIRFRIEQGAVAVLAPSPEEQTVTAPSTVPGQAVEITVAGNTEVNGGTGAVGLTVEPVASPPGVGALPGASYDFGPMAPPSASRSRSHCRMTRPRSAGSPRPSCGSTDCGSTGSSRRWRGARWT